MNWIKKMNKWSERMSENPPPPFNPEFRKGFGEAVSKEYGIQCEQNPNFNQEDRKRLYRDICNRLESQFPSIRELGTYAY